MPSPPSVLGSGTRFAIAPYFEAVASLSRRFPDLELVTQAVPFCEKAPFCKIPFKGSFFSFGFLNVVIRF